MGLKNSDLRNVRLSKTRITGKWITYFVQTIWFC